MKNIKICILTMTIVLLMLTACSKPVTETLSTDVKTTSPEATVTPSAPVIKEVSLKAVGDIMFHEYQLKRSYDSATETFDFEDSFANINEYLTSADFTIGNLETTFGGANGAYDFSVEKRVAGYSGYPCFCTPDIAAKNIKNAGFDLVTTANNHSLDSKEAGLFRTLDVLDQNGILHVGTYRNQEESDKIVVKEINGISFAFVSFTYAMNGFTPPEGHEYIINALDMYDPVKLEQMYARVRKAAELNTDFVVVMPHFGSEYSENYNSSQEEIVNALFEAGADIIFGSHPHVLQPMDIKSITRADGSVDQGIVIYSLGNFISSQKYEPGVNKDLGVIMGLDFKKVDQEKTRITGISLVPTYTYWQDDVIGVLPVDETLEKVDTQSLGLSSYDMERLNFAKTYSIKHLLSGLEAYPYTYNQGTYYIDLK